MDAKGLQNRLALIRREAEERDAERRAKRSGYEYVNLSKTPVSIEALRIVPEAEAKAAKVAVLEIKARKVAVAVFDPHASAVQQIVQNLEHEKYEIRLFVASLSGLAEAWRLYKFVSDAAHDITGKVGIEKQQFEELLGRLTSFQAVAHELGEVDFHKINTTHLFEIILAGALGNRASDIHFEAEEDRAKVRFRLDGVLHDIADSVPMHNYQSLLSRIKLLSGLKINVYGEPQDGRFTIDLPGKEIEVRVSIIPSEFGETIVMRVLDPDSIQVKLEVMGLREDALALVRQELKKPNGLILNTGPTGSGKTTTLYAFLHEIVDPEIKIITIEDPIEYRIKGIEQTQVNADVGYTFANGLRAILRQDPDVILVGEIRDEETADIAMQASLTGHLVFSTLHANDAVATAPRLLDLHIKPETLGPALSLIIAQRLVRILCPSCKKKKELTPDAVKSIERFLESLPPQVKRDPYRTFVVYEPAGCDKCSGVGYRGRSGIFEFLEAGPEFEAILLKEPSEAALRKLALSQHMVTLQQDGILKALGGTTTFDEVEKVTGPIAWE